METTKAGVLVTILVLVFGLGMFVLEGKSSGALVASGQNRCEETETLFPKSDGDLEAKQSIFLKGGTKTKVGTAPWSSVTQESCGSYMGYAGGDDLSESYCLSNGTATLEFVTCQNGCTNGKCNPPTCADSDGVSYTTVGTTTGLYIYDSDALGVPPVTQSAKTYIDTCISTTMLKEYKCSSINNNFVVFEQKNCVSLGTGYTCSNGACVAPAPIVEICDGVDNTGNGVKDEGCDDDNDNYCDSSMTRAATYSCSGSNNCCSSGGGDCNDNAGHIKPSSTGNDYCVGILYLNIDNDCDGQVDEGCEICDNLDNDNNGVIDDYCDFDNDNYCDKSKGIIGTPSTCTNGGGDCVDYSSVVYPGAPINCFDGGDDDNCDGVNDGCTGPYSCVDNEPTNNPTIGGTLILTADSGQTTTIADSCAVVSPGINETICLQTSSNSNNWWDLSSVILTSCPAGTVCSDSDGAIGTTPAVCS